MNLTTPIQAYFEAERNGDGLAVAATFHPDAVVRDEGRAFSGRQAIRAWWEEAKTRAPHVVEPLGMGGQADAVTVRARVSGEFPGSPVVLDFAFRLDGDRIAALEITA